MPLWLDLTAVAVGAASASTVAENVQHRQGRRIDWLGITILGISAGLGGGFLRDILMGLRPATIQSNWYLVVAVVSALLGMFLSRLLQKLQGVITIIDALSLGLFTSIGIIKALWHDMDPIPAIMIGVVSGVGGGAIRDILLQVPVGLLHTGTFYATASLVGSCISIIFNSIFPTSASIVLILCTAITFSIRMASIKWGLSLPEQMSLRIPNIKINQYIKILRF